VYIYIEVYRDVVGQNNRYICKNLNFKYTTDIYKRLRLYILWVVFVKYAYIVHKMSKRIKE
jgi:hypothetical protein